MSDPLALSNPFAELLVFGPIVGSAVVEHRWFHGDARRRWADRTYRELQAWQIAGVGLGLLFAKEAAFAALDGAAWLWPVLGCAVGLSGVAIRMWAIQTLGLHFTRSLQVGADHQLVVDGPYRFVRHPSYAGAILIFAGVGIGLANAASIAALLLLPTIGYCRRIAREESLLRAELPKSYQGYASRTRRLLPGLW